MLSKTLPVLILAVTAILTAAAIEFLPATLYFPVVDYSMPGDIQIVMFKYGEPDIPRCERSLNRVVESVRASCPDCKYTQRCVRGLDSEHRKTLGFEPLTTVSLRTENGGLTLTVSAKNPHLALTICRLIAQQTAAQTANKKLLCFPALTSR